jgi:phospholipase D1/2
MFNEFIGLSQVRESKGVGLYPALYMEHKTCKAQLLRSVSAWSIGFSADMVENSIHKAYIHHIGQARNFIYIENQYFMSSYDTIDCPLKNKVAEALFNRILIAHLNHENFKVLIVIPLYPGSFFTTP